MVENSVKEPPVRSDETTASDVASRRTSADNEARQFFITEAGTMIDGSSDPSMRAPTPKGFVTGRRTGTRRSMARLTAAVNRGLDHLFLGSWLHRRIQRSLEFTDVDVPLARDSAGLDGLRIAFLSDLHAGSFMNARDLENIFLRVMELEPDLVLFGGDLINTRDRELLLFREPLKKLSARYGVYAVPGNHDWFWGSDASMWRSFLEENGVQVLLNGGCRIEHNGSSLWLAGVDDLTEGTPRLDYALAGRQSDEPCILISHHPDFFFEAAAADVDLTLAGHTHGGQVKVLGKALIHHSKFGYIEGAFNEEDSRLYVSRGVGVTFLPLRIKTPPEIPMLTLRCGASANAESSEAGNTP